MLIPSVHRLIRFNGPSRLSPHIHCGESSGLSGFVSPCIGRIIHLCYILTFPALRKDLFSSGECVNGANIFPLRRFNNCLSREDFTIPISSFGNVTGFRPYSKSLLRSRWISYLYRMLSQSSIFWVLQHKSMMCAEPRFDQMPHVGEPIYSFPIHCFWYDLC